MLKELPRLSAELRLHESQFFCVGDPIGDDIADVAAQALRILNVNGLELIDHVFTPAFGAYTPEVLAEVANDHRVMVETEIYKALEELFYQVRNGTADLDAFFSTHLGKNL